MPDIAAPAGNPGAAPIEAIAEADAAGATGRGPDASPIPRRRPPSRAPARFAGHASKPRPASIIARIQAEIRAAARIEARRAARKSVAFAPSLANVRPGAPPLSAGPAATRRADGHFHGVSLMGVYGKPGARRALLRMPDGSFQRVRPGQVIEGWRVADIAGDRLRLTRGGEKKVLRLPSP